MTAAADTMGMTDATDATDMTDDMEALKHLHDGGDYRRLAERTSNPDVLRRLAIGEYPFVWHAIADNPAAPTDLLAALAGRRQQVWNDNRLLRLLSAHPALTGEALDGLVDLVGDRLREGDRPYAAVLELARRPELSGGAGVVAVGGGGGSRRGAC
ncbi:hypothetical protein, partial [Kitasatospora sp. NPDC001225]